MLKIILNRLKLQAEKMIAEEQAGFRAGLSTTEQIFNLRRILCEKYHQHQQDFYCVFIGSKKALGFTYSFLGNHEEAQHKCQPFRVIKYLCDRVSIVVPFSWLQETDSEQ